DKEFATIIIDEVSRLEKILTNVLTYSRETPVHRERHNIKDVVEESLKPYKDKFENKSIVISAELNGATEVMMDRDQVREVFNNILSNALDSMADGGMLTISCAPELIQSRKYMAVHFRDTGEGISEDNIKVIFEPFYTTKIIGQGTGLGLPISKKIMEDHGGIIAVDSAVGKGSTFSLYFPLNGE
ncbi:MAG: HAMP domain-containing histidine kinase, partial [Nitrospiraceae bacterium]